MLSTLTEHDPALAVSHLSPACVVPPSEPRACSCARSPTPQKNIVLVVKEGSRWANDKGLKVCDFPPYRRATWQRLTTLSRARAGAP